MSENMENNSVQPSAPAAQQTVAQTAAQQTAPQPVVQQAAPAVQQTAPQPVAQPSAPAVQQAAPQPTAQQTAPQPVVQQAAPQPASAPAPQPATQAPESKQGEKQESQSEKGDKKNGKKDDKKNKKRKTDWGGRLITSIVSIILGFVLGVGSVYGAVAAVIYSLGTQPVDETVELIDTLTGLDLATTLFGEKDENGNLVKSGILNYDYAEKKIKDLIGDVVDAVGGLMGEGTTLGDIAEISPFVGEKVNELINDINGKFGTKFTYADLIAAPITGGEEGEVPLTDYLMQTFMKTEAGDLINSFLEEGLEMNPIIKAFCYGQEGLDYTVNEKGEIVSIHNPLTLNDFFAGDMLGLLDNVPIDLLLTVDPENALMRSLAYGEAFRYTVKTEGEGEETTSTVVMNQMYYGWAEADGVYTFYDNNNPDKVVEYALCKVKNQIAELSFDTGKKDENEQPIYTTYYVNLNDGKVWQNEECTTALPYSKITIGNLRADALSVVDNIALADVITLDSEDPGPLNSIVYAQDGTPRTIGQLRQDSTSIVDGIKLVDILGEDNKQLNSIVYKEVDDGNGNLVKVSRTIADLDDPDLVNNIKIAEILGVEGYDADNPLHAIIYTTDKTTGEKVSIQVSTLTEEYADGTTFIDNIKVADILGIKEDDDSPLTSILYKKNEDTQKVEALTLHQLGEDKDLINDIKLADVMDLNDQTSKAILSIVFKGKYKLVDGKYVPFDDAEENASRTLGELTSDKDIINKIKLEDVLNPDGTMDNKALLSIIYQKDETTGEFKTDGEGNRISNDIGALTTTDGANKIINNISLADVLNADGTQTNKTLLSIIYKDEAHTQSRTLKELSEGADGIINNISLADVIAVDEDTHPALLSIIYKDEAHTQPRILKDLSEGSTEIIDSIKLSDVMDTTDPMLLSIIYEDGYVTDSEGKIISGTSRTLKDFKPDENGNGGAQDIINKIKLADVLGIDKDSHKALIFLAYGNDTATGTPRTLGEIRSEADSGDLINNIPLSYIITPNMDDKIVSYLIYGMEDIHYTLKNGEAEMLQRHIAINGGKVYNEYGEEIGTYDGSMTYTEGEFTYNLVSGSITSLQTKDGKTATVYYLTDSENQPVMFTETTLHEFVASDNAITKLTSRLTASDILGDDINNNKILRHLANTPLDQLSNAITKLTFGQVFAEEIYENGTLKGVWKYMLMKDGEDMANEYTVLGDMNTMLDNMIYNVNHATLGDLDADGILDIQDSVLTRELITQIGTETFSLPAGIPANAKIGSLTTKQILAYVDALLAAIDSINANMP